MADAGDDAGSNPMGKASGMYDEAVSQAGPGLVANALLLVIITELAASIVTFLDADGDFSPKFHGSFVGLKIMTLVIVAIVLACKAAAAGSVKPLSKSQVLSITGVLGLIIGALLVLATFIGLGIDYGPLVSENTFGTFLSDLGWSVAALGAGLWATAETRNA